MIDLVTIYLIFSTPHDFDFNKIKNIKKNIKKNSKKNSKTKKKIVLKNNIDNNSIEIYDENKSTSLHTYN